RSALRHTSKHPGQRAACVVHEDLEVARVLDEPGCVLRIRNVGLECLPARLRSHGVRFLASRVVADDDLGAGPRELECDRTSDPARAAGDERTPSGERAAVRHRFSGLQQAKRCSSSTRGKCAAFCAAQAEAMASSTLSSAARLLTGIALTLLSIRFTRPDRTLPGPISTNVRTPSRTSSEAACVNRT